MSDDDLDLRQHAVTAEATITSFFQAVNEEDAVEQFEQKTRGIFDIEFEGMMITVEIDSVRAEEDE